jgi:hypothetical protein
MKEAPVEKRLKDKLEAHGFLVVKLVTPGYNGIMDRLIFRPKWSPGAPYFLECKRPGESLRRLQEIVHDDLRSRGSIVLEPVSCYDEVDATVDRLLEIAREQKI